MEKLIGFVKTTLIGGFLIVFPVAVIYMLLKRATVAIHPLLEPVMSRLPSGLPFPGVIALTIEVLAVVLGCFVAGLIARTAVGRRLGRALEARLFEKVPGYKLLRSLTRRAAGTEQGESFASALAIIEDALVPAFIVEHHPDGRYTVFVPAAPTPGIGAIYILPPERVYPVDVPFFKTVRCITRWGAGSAELLGAMRTPQVRNGKT